MTTLEVGLSIALAVAILVPCGIWIRHLVNPPLGFATKAAFAIALPDDRGLKKLWEIIASPNGKFVYVVGAIAPLEGMNRQVRAYYVLSDTEFSSAFFERLEFAIAPNFLVGRSSLPRHGLFIWQDPERADGHHDEVDSELLRILEGLLEDDAL